ncbi:unnamed protein product [Leuciscus chuanchicus]
MCAPGNCVIWDCTDEISTTCLPCPPLTFTDEPNGLMKCFPCSVCNANRGLRVNKAYLDNISNNQVLAPQILCVLTAQVTHIQTGLSHPVYHTQNVMPWDLLKQIQEHNHLTVNVEIPRLLQQPLLLVL